MQQRWRPVSLRTQTSITGDDNKNTKHEIIDFIKHLYDQSNTLLSVVCRRVHSCVF